MRTYHKVMLGILVGVVAGIIDVIPMIMQHLTWDANLSAFTHWVIIGLVIATSTLPLKGAFKGLVIALVLFIPVGILVGWKEPVSLIPMIVMSFILGSVAGYVIEKFGKEGA